MHIRTLNKWRHPHDFAVIHEKGERRTLIVLVMTAITMIVEILAGTLFGSMALLADGWHMGTHAAAFMITIFAYRYARKNEKNPQFTFGTGKVSVLGGFSSAIALLVVALVMAIESIQRIFNPQSIHFNEAIGVAIIGLLINLVCAFILRDHHDHHHSHHDHAHHGHGHEHHHDHDHHQDHNLKAAYFHVLADALTSILAIAALFFGKMFAWNWLDPLMGVVGALIITRWSFDLLTETSPILLDKNIEKDRISVIKSTIESDSDNLVSDLHLWKVGPNDYAVIISLVTHAPKPVEHYKTLLKDIVNLSHITIEVNQCAGKPCFVREQTSTL